METKELVKPDNKSKLDQFQRDFVIERVIAGDTNAEIADLIEKHWEIKVSNQSIAYYRKLPEVRSQLERNDTEVAQAGFASRVQRIKLHNQIIDGLLNRMFVGGAKAIKEGKEAVVSEVIWNKDLAPLIGQLRDEMKEIGRLVGESVNAPVTIVQTNVQVNNPQSNLMISTGGVTEENILDFLSKRTGEGQSLDEIAGSLLNFDDAIPVDFTEEILPDSTLQSE